MFCTLHFSYVHMNSSKGLPNSCVSPLVSTNTTSQSFCLAFFRSRHTHQDPSHSNGLLLEKHHLPTELEDGLVLTSKKRFTGVYLCYRVRYLNFAGSKVSTEASYISEATSILENYQGQGTGVCTNSMTDC